MEIPKSTKEIKGEIEWWDALKYGKMTWHDVFVQLKRDGSLMDQLTEDTNSLQHFLQLETVPLHPGISFQINQNSSRVTKEHVDQIVDSPNETRKMSTQKIPHFNKDTQSKYFGTAFKMWGPPRPVRSRHQLKMSKEIKVGILVDDGHSWRKYGQKEIPGSLHPRGYYRCTFKHTHGCLATKQVQKTDEDPSVFKVVYRGQHTCNCSSTATESVYTNLTTKDSPTATESFSTFTDWDFEVPKRPQVLDTCKKKSSSIDIAKWIQLQKRSPHDSNFPRKPRSIKGIEVGKTRDDGKIRRQKSRVKIRYSIKESKGVLDDEEARDGYIWRKYGQKGILGSNYPRAYYKCSARGCPARKHVQRSSEDLSLVEVCYSGNHTCPTVLLHNNASSTATESVSTITGEIPTRPQVLDKKGFMNGGNVRWTQLVKVSPKDGWFNIPPDDGYTWKKHGKHDILGAKYSTGYYQCTSCKARKEVKRSDEDRSILEITYEGIHTCLTLSANNYSTNSSESALKISDSSTAIKSSLQILKTSGSSITAESTSVITDNSFGLDSSVHYLDLNQIDAGPDLEEWTPFIS